MTTDNIFFKIFVFLLIFSLCMLIRESSKDTAITLYGACIEPFSQDINSKCFCANDCLSVLECANINNERKCVNVLSDYLREREPTTQGE
jgi:hypothetical protein